MGVVFRFAAVCRAVADPCPPLPRPALPAPAATAANEPPLGQIVATLAEPVTYYSLSVTDPDGDPLTYDWLGTSVSCGTFLPSELDPAAAVWDHPDGTGAGECTHVGEPTDHPGTIEAPVRDSTGNELLCAYDGSLSGEDICVVPPECHIYIAGGIEPSQGVWQDDLFFRNLSGGTLGNKLVQVTPNTFRAELPMVRGRPTLLFGVEEPLGGAITPLGHYKLVITLTTNCAGQSTPVEMRFRTLGDAGGTLDHTTSGLALAAPLDGTCCLPADQTVVRKYDILPGLPPRSTFTFTSTGSYTIEGELVRQQGGAGTGLKISVSGEVVDTAAPRTLFAPVIVSGADAKARARLRDQSDRLMAESAAHIPDYFPLAAGPLPTTAAKLADLSSAMDVARRNYTKWLREQKMVTRDGDVPYDFIQEALIAELDRRFGAAGQLSSFDRVVLVMRVPDMKLLTGDQANVALSQKVVLVGPAVGHDTVAHELAHTMPYVWSSNRMLQECGFDYHDRRVHVANGFQITDGGSPVRTIRDAHHSYMGLPAADWWTDQCTYWNLVNRLQALPDPPAILVQGRLARGFGHTAGELLSAYRMEAALGAGRAGSGGWAIVLRDQAGAELGRYGLAPAWAVPDAPGLVRNVLTFARLVPDLPGFARIDLVGPDGLLDSRAVSVATPTVAITSPSEGSTVTPAGGLVPVAWTASDADGDPLRSSVLYSSDGGATWLPAVFETKASSAGLALEAGSYRVKVIVTDGTRSAQATVAFTVA